MESVLRVMPLTRLAVDAFGVVTICLVSLLILFDFLCIIYSCYFRSRIHSQGFVQLGYFSGPWIIRITFILFTIWWGIVEIVRLSLLRSEGRVLNAFTLKWQETVCKYYIVSNLGFAEPCLFITLVFLLRAPLQRMESGILSQKWNGKTAGYVLLYCVPVFALQLIIILIGPNFNKGFLPLSVLLLGLSVMYEPEQVVFEALAFLAFLSLLCCAGVSIWMLVYCPVADSLALRSLLDLEARRRISDDHNETISLIANQSLLGESMGVSPQRNSNVSTKRRSISFRTEKDGTSVDTYVELSLFSPSQHATPPGSPRPLGWPMIPPHQFHAP